MRSFVSVIIPCRNEEKYIGKCLDSILAQDYPKESLEILVVDGMSEDKTREIIKTYSSKYSIVKLLENKKRFTNFAFNMGIKEAKGGLIMLAGAHARYENNYISKAVEYINKYNADCVGGALKTQAAENTIVAKSIALALSGNIGTGGSRFRTGSEDARWVDTVFGGCYKKEIFEKVGMFNENLQRSQDMEFNLRLRKAGGKILLVPDIVAYYYPSATLKDFFAHNFKDGIWAIYPFKFTRTLFKPRHYVPLAFVSILLALLFTGLFFKPFIYVFSVLILLYVLVLLYSAVMVAVKQKDATYLVYLPLALAIRHFAYGFGSVFGIIKLLKW